MTTELTGILSALATPFAADESIDIAALHRVIDHSINGGVHGVVAGGSTGEFASLLPDERLRLVDEVIAHTDGRVPVIAQTGATSTQEAIRHSRAAQASGADVLMVVTPYYEPLGQDVAVDYLRRVADAVDLPIMLYNIPAATGVHFDVDTVAALAAEFPHIRYLKDSSADWERGLRFIHGLRGTVGTFIGWDVYAHSALTEGAAGIMAGTANVVAPQLAGVHAAITGGDAARGRELWQRLYPAIAHMFADGFVSAVKTGLELRGVCSAAGRHPLPALPDDARQRLARLLEELDAAGLAA